MSDYHLGISEFAIMESNDVSLREGTGEHELDEIILTNENLALVDSVSTGLFTKQAMVKRCPLEKIKDAEYDPQVFVTKLDGAHWLQIVFEDETIAVTFGSDAKWRCNHWAQAIKLAALGDFASIDADAEPPTQADELVSNARDFIGGIFGKNSNRDMPPDPATRVRPTAVSMKCTGCHAPLTGRQGMHVTCPYCDTTQTL